MLGDVKKVVSVPPDQTVQHPSCQPVTHRQLQLGVSGPLEHPGLVVRDEPVTQELEDDDEGASVEGEREDFVLGSSHLAITLCRHNNQYRLGAGRIS